jgi:hypothetical protein
MKKTRGQKSRATVPFTDSRSGFSFSLVSSLCHAALKSSDQALHHAGLKSLAQRLCHEESQSPAQPMCHEMTKRLAQPLFHAEYQSLT